MKAKDHETHTGGAHYRHLLLMTLLSFASMYALMYTMVDKLANALPNVNQFFMAGLMSMPMVLIELIVMRSMYRNRKANIIILSAAAVAAIAFFFSIRTQAGVGDRQFLRSMIPHHAAALLMAEQADLSDPEIRALAAKIIASQQQEIDQMKAKLDELGKEN